VLPDAERGQTTVVIFQEASVGGQVAPLPGLLEKEDTHARYKSIEIEEYMKETSMRWSKGHGSSRASIYSRGVIWIWHAIYLVKFYFCPLVHLNNFFTKLKGIHLNDS
jgi:hypothetical protein